MVARSLDSRPGGREIPRRSPEATPFRLRPTESGPRSCRSLGPELSLHAAPPPRNPAPAPPTAPPLRLRRCRFQALRTALRYDPLIEVPARISVWQRKILDRSPGGPGYSPGRSPSGDCRPAPTPTQTLIPLRGNCVRVQTGRSRPRSRGSRPDRERSVHAPCNPRSGPLVPGRPPGGWTPPGGSGFAGRFTALDGQGGFPAGAGRAHGLDALEPDRAWARCGLLCDLGRSHLPGLLNVGRGAEPLPRIAIQAQEFAALGHSRHGTGLEFFGCRDGGQIPGRNPWARLRFATARIRTYEPSVSSDTSGRYRA